MGDKPLRKGALTRRRPSQRGRKARQRAKTTKQQSEVRLKNLVKARAAKKKLAAARKKEAKN